MRVLRFYPLFGNKVNFSIQFGLKFIGQIYEFNTDRLAKIHQNINIALTIKIIPDYRAK